MKQIPNFPDYYITENGEIFSKRTKNLKKRKLSIDNFGYYQVFIIDNSGKKFNKRVHQLVMGTYGIEPPKDMISPTIDHINGDKLDNNINNLQWLSNKDNAYKANKHRIKTYLIKNKNGYIFTVKNLLKWCENNNLDQSAMRRTFKCKWWHKDFMVIAKL